MTLKDVNLESPKETGRTFLDNAILKAQHASMNAGFPAIADDSGLVVDALDGKPGVASARFAGPNATDDQNNARLIRELSALPAGASRRARFHSAVAFCTPDGFKLTAEATVQGKIVDRPRGQHGFGYDPFFELDDPEAGSYNGRTLAELTLEEKNQISHRWRAYNALIASVRRLDGQHPVRLLIDTDNEGGISSDAENNPG